MVPLDTLAGRQSQWSETANSLRRALDHARWSVFLLSVTGALLATVASQMSGVDPATSHASGPRAWVAIAAAVSLGFATFFTHRLLGTDSLTTWIRARAISEALKREAYRFSTRVAPYDQADPVKNADLFELERKKIEEGGVSLLDKLVPAVSSGSAPRNMMSHDDYIAKRVNGQINWYNAGANVYRKLARNLRRFEIVLAALATAITAVAGVTGKPAPLFGVTFDIAALTAVLTTIAGAVLAHVEASRYDFLVITYLATARRLEDRRNESNEPWSAFVNDCEDIISTENASWTAKWTK
jgi:hypothetical protein